MVGVAKQKERRPDVVLIRGMCRGCLLEERVAYVLPCKHNLHFSLARALGSCFYPTANIGLCYIFGLKVVHHIYIVSATFTFTGYFLRMLM